MKRTLRIIEQVEYECEFEVEDGQDAEQIAKDISSIRDFHPIDDFVAVLDRDYTLLPIPEDTP